MVVWAFLCCAVLSLPTLLSAQTCERLTAGDLASTGAESTDGLIAAALMSTEMLDSPPLIRLLNYNLVCEATSSVVGRIRFTSVVAEYTRNGSAIASQFEFGCANVTWGLVVSGRSTEIVTTPPDGTLNSTLRTDCDQCLSPRRRGSNSDNEHHCQACPAVCTGLMMCTNIFTCCNYADPTGRCTETCPTNSTIVNNSSCECFPGLKGEDCEIEIDECDPNPCENDGNCTDLFNGFSCECLAGYTGATCSGCNDTLCQNGGTCFLGSEGAEMLCMCPENFQGATCQEPVPMEPVGSSSCDRTCFIAILVVAVVVVLVAAILTISIGAFISSKQRGKQTISKRRKRGKKKGKVVSSPGVASGSLSPSEPQSSYYVKEPTMVQFKDPEQPSLDPDSTTGISIALTSTTAIEGEDLETSGGAQHAIGQGEEKKLAAGPESQQESTTADYQKLNPQLIDRPHDYQRPETMTSSTAFPEVTENSSNNMEAEKEPEKAVMESSNL